MLNSPWFAAPQALWSFDDLVMLKKCKEAHLKREDKEYVSNNTPWQMDLIEPQSDGCFFSSSVQPFALFRVAFVKWILRQRRRGVKRISDSEGLSRRCLIMAEAVVSPGYIRIAGFDLQWKSWSIFCPLGRFRRKPKANTLYHTASFKHSMPAASQPRICERKYLEPPASLPHTHGNRLIMMT